MAGFGKIISPRDKSWSC